MMPLLPAARRPGRPAWDWMPTASELACSRAGEVTLYWGSDAQAVLMQPRALARELPSKSETR
eukprot:2558762-Alexandrium_andersonii.AAC.1